MLAAQASGAAAGIGGLILPALRGCPDKRSNTAGKVHGRVGQCLYPTGRVLLLCVDERSRIHALNRTQPGLPLPLGEPETCTHDYQRHGAMCLLPRWT